jgi:hypothetical protein
MTKVIISKDKEANRIKVRVKTDGQLFYLGFHVTEIKQITNTEYNLYLDGYFYSLLVIEKENLEIQDNIVIERI